MFELELLASAEKSGVACVYGRFCTVRLNSCKVCVIKLQHTLRWSVWHAGAGWSLRDRCVVFGGSKMTSRDANYSCRSGIRNVHFLLDLILLLCGTVCLQGCASVPSYCYANLSGLYCEHVPNPCRARTTVVERESELQECSGTSTACIKDLAGSGSQQIAPLATAPGRRTPTLTLQSLW